MSIETHSIDKFAFIGPASVGKTTMTNILKDRFIDNPKVTIIDEGAEIFFNESKVRSHEFVDVQQDMQDFVLERERTAHTPETKLIISDRSVIDPIIYTQVYDSQDNADKLHRRVSEWIPTYTSFILLNPEGVPDDPRPHRLETSAERLTIYNKFAEFCDRNEIPYVEISGTIDERREKVCNIIFENTKDTSIFNKAI